MERVQVLEKIDNLCNLRVKPITHAPRTRVKVQETEVVFNPGDNTKSMLLTPNGVDSLMKLTHTPTIFASKLRPETFQNVTNEMLNQQQQYVIILNDGRIDGFAPARTYVDHNPERVLNTIDRALHNGSEVQRVMPLDNYGMVLDITGDKEQAVAPGDLVRGGVTLQFSPIGTIQPIITPYVFRLWCSNGASHQDFLGNFKFMGDNGRGGGNAGDFWGWLKTNSQACLGTIDRILERYRRLMTENIPEGQRAEAIAALLDQCRIPDRYREAIYAEAAERPVNTAYDVFNLLTWGTTHAVDDPTVVMRARKKIDEFTIEETHARHCPVCHAARNN